MAYVQLQIGSAEPTLDAYQQSLRDRIAARITGWDANAGDPIAIIADEIAAELWDARQLVRDGGAATLVSAGRSLYGVPSDVAASATLVARFDFTDASGHTVPTGTQVSYSVPDSGDVLEFESVGDVSIAAGYTAADVPLRAVFPGAAYNVVPAGVPMSLDDVVAAVAGVSSLSASSGGVDPEDDQSYLDKLADDQRTLRQVADNETSASILARNVDGVWRALAVDGWNPGNGTLNQDLYVGIAALDQAGRDVPDAVGQALIAYLTDDARRGLNVQLVLGKATRTAVHVAFNVTASGGYDPGSVQTAAVQAIRDFIDPALFSGGRLQPPEWHGDRVVRYLDIVQVLGRVPGVESTQLVTLNGSSGVDVLLSGVAALPAAFDDPTNPSTVTGTVSRA